MKASLARRLAVAAAFAGSLVVALALETPAASAVVVRGRHSAGARLGSGIFPGVAPLLTVAAIVIVFLVVALLADARAIRRTTAGAEPVGLPIRGDADAEDRRKAA